LRLLLHDLRTPLGVAQGYLRLLREDRLQDIADRQRAVVQSMEALGRISHLCAGAAEFAAAGSPAESSRYPAADLVAALGADAPSHDVSLAVLGGPVIAQVVALAAGRAAASIMTIFLAAARHDPTRARRISVGIHGGDVLITSGDEFVRERLIGSAGDDAFDPWTGGCGLLLPLAVRQLRETGARIWTLADEPSAIAIALPLEPGT
jgi:signal transduction histidine kinase